MQHGVVQLQELKWSLNDIKSCSKSSCSCYDFWSSSLHYRLQSSFRMIQLYCHHHISMSNFIHLICKVVPITMSQISEISIIMKQLFALMFSS